MNNSKLQADANRPYENPKLLLIVGLIAAAVLLWLLYLYVFVWGDTPFLAQLVKV